MKRVLGNRRIVYVVGLVLIGFGVFAVARGLSLFWTGPGLPAYTPSPSRLEERLIPTMTARAEATASPSVLPAEKDPTAPSASATPVPTPLPTGGMATQTPSPTTAVPRTSTPEVRPIPGSTAQPAPTQTEMPGLYSPRQRIGFVAPLADVEQYNAPRLGAGWYLSCINGENPLQPSGMECAQLVVVTGDGYRPAAASLQYMARRNPGRLWLVGNEPDVIWQGNSTPAEYVRAYHEIYFALKEADPSCQVAIGGISQVTPLRLRYLEEVFAAYEAAHGQPMPVDVWNIHLAILREERGSWGVDIPPGLPDDSGILYEIEDHANVEILKEQVVTFRRWMAERGLRDKPLIVTEFSVLMPPDYGFPFEVVKDFMLDAADYLMTATDGDLGYPVDGNRLVQRWAWYSAADTLYATGNLFDPSTGQITPLGKVFADYAAHW